MEANPFSCSRNQCWMAAEGAFGSGVVHSVLCLCLSTSEVFLGEVSYAVPEFGPTNAVSGYYGGVHDAEDD